MTQPQALWRHPAFSRFWAAQAVSSFGARITREGLPILAVTTLATQASGLGVLSAIAGAAAVLTGLAGGRFVDSRARRPILVGADIFRTLVLLTIPLAAALHILALPQVLIVAALVGAAGVLFDMASHAYLPGLIGPEQLMDGNARLASTDAVAEMGGPALAGLLFQRLSAPFALAVNAGTYLASGLFLLTIRQSEPPPEIPAPQHWTAEISEGLRLAWGEPRVRALLLMGLIQGLFGGVFSALYILFALKTLNLPTSLLGIAIAMGGVGALVSAWLGPWLARKIGVGPAIIATITGASLSALMIATAPTDRTGAMTVMILTQITGDAFGGAAWMLMATLRQGIMPQAVLGRVAGAFQASAGLVAIPGDLGGGWLGTVLGVRETLMIAAAGFLVIPLIGMLSPLRAVRVNQ
jgi:MFS family permease